MYTIYGFNTYNAEKVVLTAEELGIDYQYTLVDLASAEQQTPEYLKIHPLGKIPALVHDGNTLIESAAICRYLANTNEQRLYSTNPLEAARIDAMIDIIVQQVGKHLSTYFYEKVVKIQLYQQEPDSNALSEADENLANLLPYIDQRLSDHCFLCSDEITIADTIAFPYFRLKELADIDLSPYKNILRWYDEFSGRPSVAATAKTLGPSFFE